MTRAPREVSCREAMARGWRVADARSGAAIVLREFGFDGERFIGDDEPPRFTTVRLLKQYLSYQDVFIGPADASKAVRYVNAVLADYHAGVGR